MSACGALDELNCSLGVARAALSNDPKLKSVARALVRIQADCFSVGHLLAAPRNPCNGDALRAATAKLECEIDAWDKELPPLKTFILPGGSAAAAALHVARAATRRAERQTVALSAVENLPESVLAYLNRLSSWLFTAARRANQLNALAETPWKGPISR